MTLTLALLSGGREHLLNALETHTGWQRARIKSPEGAASVLVELAKGTILDEASALILPEIQGWYKGFIKANGERLKGPLEDWDKANNWDEAHDDGVMALFEPFANTLSASWLAFTSTDVKLWQEGEDEKLATSFANEVWKQLSWKKTNNQILAGVGIVHADLAKFGYMPPEPVSPTKPEFNPMRVNAVLNRIMLSMPDPGTLADELDLASEEDALLRAGAAGRLGISSEDAELLYEARQLAPGAPEAWFNAIDVGELLDETVNYVDLSGEVDEPEQVDNASPAQDNGAGPDLPVALRRLPPLPGTLGTPSPLPPAPGPASRPLPPLPPSAPATAPSQGVSTEPPPPPRGNKKRTPPEPPRGAIALDVLRSIKEHAGIKDEVLADMMGISRPTLANIMKGKSHYVPPDPSRRLALLNMLVQHTKALTDAYNAINV